MRYIGLILLGLVSISIFTATLVSAESPVNRGIEEIPVPEIGFRGGWGRLRYRFLFNTSPSEMIELAYTIRNVTYELIRWEIGYNVTAARVKLELGDRFLERALNLSERAPRRASVFAFVASIQYSHSVALANMVLAKTTRNNLGENNTITETTVQAVISLSRDEFKPILMNAIEYAETRGYNTTRSRLLVQLADSRLEKAQEELEVGNVTTAFRYAVLSYRTYVKAYSTLIKSIYRQTLKTDERISLSLVEYVEKPVNIVISITPPRIREIIREKIEKGARNISEIAQSIRIDIEKLRVMEKERIREVVRYIMARYNISLREILEVLGEIERYYREGYRGTELARRIIQDILRKLEEHGYRIPRPPGDRVVIQPLPPPRK